MTREQARSIVTMFALGVYYLDNVAAGNNDVAAATRRVFCAEYNARGLRALVETGYAPEAFPERLDPALGWNPAFRLVLFAVLSFITRIPLTIPRYFNQLAAWWRSNKSTVEAKIPLGALELVMPLEWAAPSTDAQVTQTIAEAFAEIDRDAAAARAIESDPWVDEDPPLAVSTTVAAEAAQDLAATDRGAVMEVVDEQTGAVTSAPSPVTVIRESPTIRGNAWKWPDWPWIVGGVVVVGGLGYGLALLARDRKTRRGASGIRRLR